MKILVAIKQVPERDALAATGEGAPQLVDIAQLVARGLPER